MINYFIALANICFVFVKFIFVSYGLNLFFLLYVINNTSVNFTDFKN